MNIRRLICLTGVGGLLVLSGCTAMMTENQMEDVAKNWCMTIRASQVIPVYPLTEDLQPGDVFLVQVPIQKQEQIYKDRGFLPLDQLMVRLNPLDYQQFYFDSYFKSYYEGNALDRPEADPNSLDRQFRKAPLPMAAFPSYTFDVDTSTGVRVALPVKGIPVGMGLMNASSATGSITISDGMTYAIGTEEVRRSLHDWALDPAVRRMLRDLQLTTKGEVYLRVVTRVYMVGAVDVSLIRKKAGGAGVDAGEAPTVHLVNLRAGDANDSTAKVDVNDTKAKAKAYQEILDELSSSMTSTLPGGSMRIAWASGNMVALKEKFPRLLAIGYLGFDVPISKDGSLGPLIATRDHIDPDVALRPVPRPGTGPVAWTTINNLYRMLTAKGASDEEKELTKSMDFLFEMFVLPDNITFYKRDLDEEADEYYIVQRPDRGDYDNTELTGFSRLNALYGVIDDSIDILRETIQGKRIKKGSEIVKPSSEERRRYQTQLDRQEDLRESLVQIVRQCPAVRKALEMYFGDILHGQKENER